MRRDRWRRAGWALAIAASGVGLLLSSACTGFGQLHREPAEQAVVEASPQWHDGHFANPQPMWNDLTDALLRAFETAPAQSPDGPVPVRRSDGEALATLPASGLRVTWFGHSSTLLEIDGTRVLVDPIWSERPSPLGWIGPKRWFAPPIALDRLPPVDVVLVSHDHYDHLDAPTVKALLDRGARFVVPLGIGGHLRGWGVPAQRIVELDWWQATQVGTLTVTSTPARHASGRVNPQADKTLWSGFALAGPQHRVYYSGDTGLFPAMSDIGARLGPFDLTLIEAGQYDADWPDWHLGPEQAVQAHLRVRGKLMMPVHWGLFALAHHGWTEPVERVLAAAACQGVSVLAPQPGQSVEPGRDPAVARWWPVQPWRSAAEKPIVATKNGRQEDRVALPACVAAATAS
jgi:L-ascorbate metabolism protein UlaG (beta-lactamase superfamily)